MDATPRDIFQEGTGMLVITRKRGETITITTQDGQRIEVVLIEMQKSRARIAVKAPGTVKVVRGELEQRAA